MLESQQILQDRYQLQQKLGENPIRQTWLAEDLETQDTVIVKLLAFGGNVQWQELKLFEREAQILQQLDHPRISKYRDYFSIDDQSLWFGLVKDYIPGKSLQELLTAGRRFSEREIQTVAKEVLAVLIYLHGLHPPVLHRDIKPSNLILGDDDQVYLVDFGAVQDKAATEGGTFTVVGTYGYAAMEQFGGRAVPASDLYGLGATLIHLLTGVSPAELPTQNLKIQFRDRASVNTNPAFLAWVEKLTQPAIERRFQHSQEALKTLNNQLKRKKIKSSQIATQGSSDPFILPANSNLKVYKTDLYLKVDQFSGFSDLHLNHPLFLYLSAGVVLCFSFFTFPLSVFLFVIGVKFIRMKKLHRFCLGMTLMLYRQNYVIEKNFLGITYSKQRGKSSLISEVSLDYQPIASSKQQHQGYRVSGINIIAAISPVRDLFQKHTIGGGLSTRELDWLIEEIKSWLSSNVEEEE